MHSLMSRNRVRTSVCVFTHAVFATVLLTGSAAAQTYDEQIRSLIDGSVVIELQNDLTVDSDDPSTEINDLFATVEIALGLNLTSIFSVQTLMVLEPVLDPDPFDDRFFGDHGGYVEELFLQAAFDNFRVFLGKFDASFGIAWDAAPGVYGTDFAEDYELAERLGGGFEVTFGDMYSGNHTIRANAFFADTSVLSESIFTNRGRTRRSSGGPSNTEALDSISVTLDGGDMPALDGVSYHLGFRHQSPGIGDESDELGLVAGLQKTFDLENGAAIETIIEGVSLHRADTGPDDIYYLTTGAAYIDGPWTWSASHTLRKTMVILGSDVTDHLAQASLGYEIAEGTSVNAGYRYSREAGIETHIFGLLFAMEFDFEDGPPLPRDGMFQ
jgi:hypothetical protein